MFPNLADDTAAIEEMVCSDIMNTLVLLVDAILTKAEGDMRSCGLNLTALPRETLYQL